MKKFEEMIIEGCQLLLTYSGFSEQYGVYKENARQEIVQIGYLKLRGGYFTAEYPNREFGEVVYSSNIIGHGEFDDDEREAQLTNAIKSLLIEDSRRYHG